MEEYVTPTGKMLKIVEDTRVGEPVRIYPVQIRRDMYFDGVDDYAVVGLQPDNSGTPFTVYGWSAITVETRLCLIHPKANPYWSKAFQIGETWADFTSIVIGFWPQYEWTIGELAMFTHRPDGSYGVYALNLYDWRNQMIDAVLRLTEDREVSIWVNGERKVYATVPSEEKTILEWNPQNAAFPDFFKRFVIGANIGFGEHMKMIMSELRIYNRALTDSEILWLYNNGKGRPGEVGIRDGCKLCLDFSRWRGSTWVKDISGNNNHARIYGAQRVRREF